MIKSLFDPALLLASSLLLFIVAESALYALFLLSVFFLFALVVYRLYRLHSITYHLRYFHVMAYSTIFWILLGQLLSFQSFYSLNGFDFGLPYSWSESHVSDWSFLCLALSFSFLYSAVFAFLACIPIVRRQEINFSIMLRRYLTKRQDLMLTNSLIMSAFASLFPLYLVLSNRLGLRGTMTDLLSETGQSWWRPLLSLSLQLLPLTLGLTFALPQSHKFSKILSIIFLMLGFYVSFTISRRSIVYFSAVLLYTYSYLHLCFTGKWPKLRILAIAILFAATVLPSLLLFFQYIRTISLEAISLPYLFSLYNNFVGDTQLYLNIESAQAANFVARPLLHVSLAEMFRLDSFRLSYFTDVNNSLLLSLPSFLIPFKDQLVSPKELLAVSFGFFTDFRSSPQTFAYQSFGFFGAFMYPFLHIFLYITLLFLFYQARITNIAGIPSFLLLASWVFGLVVTGFPEGTTAAIIYSVFSIIAIITIVVLIKAMVIVFRYKNSSLY